MNKIDFFKYPRFPLSSETLDFLQQISTLMSKIAGIGGDNYILTGCVVTGSNVSDGIIVIGGEVLPFIGGIITSYVVIEETKRSVTAEGQVYSDIYTNRVARFGTGYGQLPWSDFKTVNTIPLLETKIASIIPVGAIVMWSGIDAPIGWHLCDGTDSTPDLRGRFIVGKSEGDTDFGAVGNIGGAKKVALSVAQMPSHTHSYTDRNLDSFASGTSGYAKPGSSLAKNTGQSGNGDSHENLPPYYVLAFIIKL